MANDIKTSPWAGRRSTSVQAAPVERVGGVLRGELIDIYCRHIPAFRGLSREKVYDMILNSPALAAACHDLFRERPDLFKGLLVGPDGAPVTDPEAALACGKSLHEVTAMVVRAVARRHFLRVFRPAAAAPRDIAEPAFLAGIGQKIRHLFHPPVPQPMPKRKATRGDSLYRALRAHLLYHWQLILIPHYTPLPVSLVRELGARILDYRSIAELQGLLREGLPTAPEQTSAAPAEVQPVMPAPPQPPSADSKSQAMLTLAKSLGLSELFAVDGATLRRMVEHASVASGSVITRLSAQGLSMSSVVVLLCSFERKFGTGKMSVLFGPQASGDFLDELAVQIDNHGIGQLHHPEDVKDRVEVLIRKMQRSEVI